MKTYSGKLRKQIFGLANSEASFERRGFHWGKLDAQVRLEQIGKTFLQGYHVALEENDLEALAETLNTVELEIRGFAFEGAAMAICLLDLLMPWSKSRFPAFLHGPGADHLYMLHVGAGWALARLHSSSDRFLRKQNPLLRWLVMDGYGFHEGYFHWPQYISRQKIPVDIHGYALRPFYQGLGRSLWFVGAADVSYITGQITAFPQQNQADLWSGIGLACAYAGGVSEDEIRYLKKAAYPYTYHLAQGAAFAAQSRRQAGNPAVHTDMACQILCNMPAQNAAQITEAALRHLQSDGATPTYEVWRKRIREMIEEKSFLAVSGQLSGEKVRV